VTVAILLAVGFALFFGGLVVGIGIMSLENRDRDRRLILFTVESLDLIPGESTGERIRKLFMESELARTWTDGPTPTDKGDHATA
jgi:hypothetical protein